MSERTREHTGIGLFIYFNAGEEVEQHKADTGVAPQLGVDANSIERINGVEIRNSKLNVLADASVQVTNGIIECLEIWNKNGYDYPREELNNYELHQVWLDKDNRRTIIR